MASAPDPKDFHKRAAESAKDTRETIIKLSTGALGVFAIFAIQTIDPPLTVPQAWSLWLSILLTVLTLGTAVFFGYADAQWSYHFAVFHDPDHPERAYARPKKDRWHGWKSSAEKLMLVWFVCAAIAMGFFLYLRTLALMA